ncbi:MAG: methionyl aminopeptidase [Archaeoglobi archaeon]|nr:methionyl aminopeptidase [Archaeoglobi archaeon]
MEALEKYRKAGRIVSEILRDVPSKVEKGLSIIELAEWIEKKIEEKGGKPAFPCNISMNEDAAHDTPSPGDERVFENQIVKIDIGVHVDGYIADSAITVDLRGEERLVEASERALEEAISIVRAGVKTGEIGKVIEETITSMGFRPVVNLGGHGLQRYDVHAPPHIPNRFISSSSHVLQEGDVIAIEPFATDGAGKVAEINRVEIFRVSSLRPVRHPKARELLEELKVYKGLPFCRRWINREGIDFLLKQLRVSRVLESYPVLREVAGGLISQFEHTVIVERDGCEVITA